MQPNKKRRRAEAFSEAPGRVFHRYRDEDEVQSELQSMLKDRPKQGKLEEGPPCNGKRTSRRRDMKNGKASSLKRQCSSEGHPTSPAPPGATG